MMKFYRDVDPQMMATIEESLKMMGVLEVKLDPENADKVYKWKGETN
jgi:hypothetical protein